MQYISLLTYSQDGRSVNLSRAKLALFSDFLGIYRAFLKFTAPL